MPAPLVTLCVLAYGEHVALARQVLDSFLRHCPRDEYQLVVGANAVGSATRQMLEDRHRAGEIDRLIFSDINLGKSAMMRLMFDRVESEFIWWFDDDSFFQEATAFPRWLQIARSSPAAVVLWGDVAVSEHPAGIMDMADTAVIDFVRSASWYRDLPPPSWRPGGKGEFNFAGRNLGDGTWVFVLGGCFMIRTGAVRAMDWPDPRLFVVAEDVVLGEAVRQQGWEIAQVTPLGIAINTAPSRGIRK